MGVDKRVILLSISIANQFNILYLSSDRFKTLRPDRSNSYLLANPSIPTGILIKYTNEKGNEAKTNMSVMKRNNWIERLEKYVK